MLNAEAGRYSSDIDLFSDREEALFQVVTRDETSLGKSGLSVEWKRRDPAFYRAVVSAGGAATAIDWAVDSDYRFFPTERDEVFGYRLHATDLATNKILAAADRSEPRDILDLVTISETILPLGAVAWAAAEKSPGRSPDMIVGELRARAKLRQEQVDAENVRGPVDAGDLNNWLRRECGQALEWIGSIPPPFEFGLFINRGGAWGAPDFRREDHGNWRIHTGSTQAPGRVSGRPHPKFPARC